MHARQPYILLEEVGRADLSERVWMFVLIIGDWSFPARWQISSRSPGVCRATPCCVAVYCISLYLEFCISTFLFIACCGPRHDHDVRPEVFVRIDGEALFGRAHCLLPTTYAPNAYDDTRGPFFVSCVHEAIAR